MESRFFDSLKQTNLKCLTKGTEATFGASYLNGLKNRSRAREIGNQLYLKCFCRSHPRPKQYSLNEILCFYLRYFLPFSSSPSCCLDLKHVYNVHPSKTNLARAFKDIFYLLNKLQRLEHEHLQ